ncbi:MAG: VWA domain-containing protein [Firmicutes bacterium]|nr:VWA domain-containing protein [Bacillota bacterium]
MNRHKMEQMANWGREMRRILAAKGAVQIGETSVLSRSLHALEATRPGHVNVLLHADAGRVFYQRSQPGEILHLDIFHSLGNIDHRRLAGAIKDFLAKPEIVSHLDGYPLRDYMDLQTGTGGGRLSGSLIYGQKESLRRAHTNHVHLTAKLPSEQWGCMVPLIGLVEGEIMDQGQQIRRVEGIKIHREKGGGEVDMSAYSSDSDSLLKGQREGGQGREQGSYSPGEAGAASKQEQLQAALDLSERVMNPRELKEIFSHFTPGKGHPATSPGEDYGGLLQQLQEQGFLTAKRGKLHLTEKGRGMKDFLDKYFTELEYHFRRLLRKIPLRLNYGSGSRQRGGEEGARRGYLKKALPIDRGETFGELAVPETMLAAVRRWSGVGGARTLKRTDLHRLEQRKVQPLDICLLIDASASMTGERLRAAKYLAQHLLLSTRDRVAVILFQEEEACLAVPFTRNLGRVQEGLKEIKSRGLTPLSLGLQFTLDYMQSHRRSSRALLFLITDGIPTVSRNSRSPGEDALTVAEVIARQGLHFGCIGLAPNKKFLEKLCQRSNGNLYIIEELEGEILAQILHQERIKI